MFSCTFKGGENECFDGKPFLAFQASRWYDGAADPNRAQSLAGSSGFDLLHLHGAVRAQPFEHQSLLTNFQTYSVSRSVSL